MTTDERAEDVAAASAACAFHVLAEISALPAPEAFRRLYDLFRGALLAFTDTGGGAEWEVPEPSQN